MRIYFSGGSPIVETSLDHPCIMPSYFVNVKKGKPDSRTKKLMSLRRKARKKNEKGN